MKMIHARAASEDYLRLTQIARQWPAGKAQLYLLGAGLCAAPVSIALSEVLLAAALALRLVSLAIGRAKLSMPRPFPVWLLFAALLTGSWLISPDRRAGVGELRHIGLTAALFVTLPALRTAANRVAVWRGIVLSATASSLVLIGRFVYRCSFHRGGVEPVVYLRGGGLLHHWMVYATVEVVVVAGLLELWRAYPKERRWILPAALVNGVAIVLSLTRMLWLCSLLLLVLHLAWRRSRWVMVVPALPLVLFLVSPAPVRLRVIESFQTDYYSNTERLQMLAVGWRMVRDRPLTGVGPGDVEPQYSRYLEPGESLPAYHGHLHNNIAQMAAQAGLPALLAAAGFIVFLFLELFRCGAQARDRDSQFLWRAGILGLTGFLAAGMVDYTYGHSVGLIVVSFAAIAPLSGGRTRSMLSITRADESELDDEESGGVVGRALR